jgi:endonuclease/exonuclease/phosphatase family metal-dependent hydrolase
MNEPQLCLATWNIHMGIGLDGARNLQRTAQVIRQIQPDLIGLQEVDNRIHKTGNDLQTLKTMTGMEVVAGPTMRRTTGDYGNALLSRLPVVDVERHDISIEKGREPRGLLIVHLDWLGERLQVAVTHLGLRAGERRAQVRRLVGCLSAGDRAPLILMGDFNEWFVWGRPRRWLQRQFRGIHSPATFPSRWPLFSLDHILADPPERLQEIRVVNTPLARRASDHLPLTANFTKRP